MRISSRFRGQKSRCPFPVAVSHVSLWIDLVAQAAKSQSEMSADLADSWAERGVALRTPKGFNFKARGREAHPWKGPHANLGQPCKGCITGGPRPSDEGNEEQHDRCHGHP